jgi:protein SCO1/2
MRLNLGAVLVGCLVWVACEAERPPAEETKARPDVRPYVDLGGDFVLVDQAGEPFALKDLRGQAALLFFGYTFCPDFCPTTLSRLGRVHELMGDNRLATVFISVDVERDTPEVLREYLAYFPIETVGLTGSRRAVDGVVELYGAEYEIEQRGEDGRYLVNHNTDVYLLDAQGRLRYVFDYEMGPEEMAEVIRALGKSGGEAEARRVEDDALLSARDLGNYGCGTWRKGQPEEFNFWNVGNPRPGTRLSGSTGEQPVYEYGLQRRKLK